MAEGKHNMKNPAVKRILQEVKEMQNNPSDDYMSLPLEDNIFEWQFAIRGPQDTEFEGGIYHGRIQLPSDYPLKPPSFMLLTPNGRFETQTKICLSISNYHPEHWQPSWSVRAALVALIAFMPTKPEGAVGSLEYTKEERHALAIKARAQPPKFGNADRQQLIDEIHEYMLKKGPPVPQLCTVTDNAAAHEQSEPSEDVVEANAVTAATAEQQEVEEPDIPGNVHELRVDANAGPLRVRISAGLRLSTRPLDADTEMGQREQEVRNNPATLRQQTLHDDRGLTLLAVGLSMAIIALLVKKFLKSYWWIGA
eukprot:Gb_31982 [translate_table: standard]